MEPPELESMYNFLETNLKNFYIALDSDKIIGMSFFNPNYSIKYMNDKNKKQDRIGSLLSEGFVREKDRRRNIITKLFELLD